MEAAMELRHLRYLHCRRRGRKPDLAAEKRLHTAQPSLSRQIRDLEYEVGVQLMNRSVHGIELTAAGRAFLDHARLALTQAEAAAEAARRAAQPAQTDFCHGLLTGQEVNWLPRATSILRDELPNIEIRVSSDHSMMLADDLQRGKLDIAFLRREQKPDLEFKLVAKEPLVVILPSDHSLAERKAIDPHDLAGETYIGISNMPHVLRAVIDEYLKRSGIEIAPHLEIDNYRDGHFSGRVDARHGSAAGLSRKFLAVVGHQPSADRRSADHRFGHRISQGEHLPDPENIPLQN